LFVASFTTELVPSSWDRRRRQLAALAYRPSAWLERNWLLVLIVTGVWYCIAVLSRSRIRPLWHDELFTYYIAQAPTWRGMMHLTRTFDLNPPLSYALVRDSIHAFGPSALATRLPSMLAFLLCLVCSFLLVRRWTSTAWGFVAMGLLLSSPGFVFTTEARPYAIVLGFISLGLLGWQRATDGKAARLVPLLLVFLAGVAALTAHVFAVLPWGMLVFAELLRSLRRRKLDWPMIVVLVLPYLVTPLYRPLLQDHQTSFFPPALQPNLGTVSDFYKNALAPAAMSLLLPVIVSLALFRYRSDPEHATRPEQPAKPETLFLLLGLLLTPGVLMLYLAVTHGAFFPRYGFIVYLGTALLLPILLTQLFRGDRRAGFVFALFILGAALAMRGALHQALRPEFWRHLNPTPSPCAACQIAASIDPSIPFVDANGLTYVEMNNRESAEFLGRVFYVDDRRAAIEFIHDTLFVDMYKRHDAFAMRAQVAQYPAFIAQHHCFFVYGIYRSWEQWLLPKLLSDGASLRLVADLPEGEYLDNELYLVKLPGTSDGPDQPSACAGSDLSPGIGQSWLSVR
jgi:hypothetical protein